MYAFAPREPENSTPLAVNSFMPSVSGMKRHSATPSLNSTPE